MNKIELTEEQVIAAFKKAKSDEVKDTLTSLFPSIAKELSEREPTLDDYTTITCYEDACKALWLQPIPEGDFQMYCAKEEYTMYVPKHIIALMKLETISRALWGRNWQPNPDEGGSKTFYWPWFYLYTKKEIDGMTIQQKECILSAASNSGAFAGFACLSATGRSSYSYARIGFRLCQETEEKARYFGGRNFVKLWAEYLQFNFEIGDFLITE